MKIKETLIKHIGQPIDNGSDRLYFSCPFCVGEHTGTKRKVFYFNVRTWYYGCFRCGETGSYRDLSQKLGFKIADPKHEPYKRPVIQASSRRVRVLLDDYCSFDKPHGAMPGFEVTLDYAASRGFTKVECGYSADHLYYVIFPIYDESGHMIYYQGRSCIDSLPKTVNPKTPKPGMFYSPVGYTNKIIIVEGIADAIAVGGHAMLGKTMTREQFRFLDRLIQDRVVDEIVVWLDSDAQGEAIKLAGRLNYKYAGAPVIRYVNWLGLEGDPDSLNHDQIEGLLINTEGL